MDRLGNSGNTPVPEWILAPHEEKEIRTRCQNQTNEKCRREFVNLGVCAQQHQLLFSWKCADLKKELLDCVAFWGGQEKYLELRDEYIVQKRQQLREQGTITSSASR